MTKVFLLLFISFAFSQNKITSVESEIQKLKEQIADLEQKSSELSVKKDLILSKIKAVDFNVKLNKKRVVLVEKSITLLDSKIAKNKSRIIQLNNEITELTTIYRNRLVSMYKYPQKKGWEAVFKAKSISQLSRFLEYKSIFDKQDKAMFIKLNKTKKTVLNEKRKLFNNQSEKKIELQNLEHYVKQLSIEQKKQATLLANINKSRSSYTKAIAEKTVKQKEFKAILVNLIKKANSSNRSVVLSKTFKKNKGKYVWPVSGKIIKKFGKIKHKKFKIYEQNDGIDIKSVEGNPVKSIHEGYVEDSFYQQGYGNTIIINHGDGFLSIYAHLDEVQVKSGDYVVANEKIGTVGNSGSLDKIAKLHFEIYGNNKPLNPVKWLR